MPDVCLTQCEGKYMVDSGAARSVCPRGWHADIPLDVSHKPPLRTASGAALDVDGIKWVPLTIGMDVVHIPMVVCSVERAIFSTNTLAAAGYVTVIGHDEAHVEKRGVRTPLERDGNHFFWWAPTRCCVGRLVLPTSGRFCVMRWYRVRMCALERCPVGSQR